MPLRIMTAEMSAALRSRVFRPCLFFEGEFSDGFLRMWTGQHPISWGGLDWNGAGVFLGFSGVSEELGVTASGWTISLSGVPIEVGELALNQIVQGKMGKVWLGARDANNLLIPNPVLIASGRMDVPSISEYGDTSTVSISFESRFIDLKQLREFRWTDQSQQTLYPGDLGCSHVTAIQTKNFVWGGKS